MIQAHRDTIAQILNRQDARLLVICGPCSIHDTHSAVEYAKGLKQLSDQHKEKLFIVMRTYFSKPRSQGGWKGFINDPYLNGSCDIKIGIEMARKLLEKINDIGLPCGTEFLNPLMPNYLGDLISWAAIGARTVESQLHREMASNLNMPIAFKNNTAGDIQSAIDGCIVAKQAHTFLGIKNNKTEIINSLGNPSSHIILRGSKTASNYNCDSVSKAEQLLKKASLPNSIIIDCSHGNSEKNHLKQIDVARNITEQIKNGKESIIGIMLESNLVAGKQPLTKNLTYGQSITDACIDLNTTAEILQLLTKNITLVNGHKTIDA